VYVRITKKPRRSYLKLTQQYGEKNVQSSISCSSTSTLKLMETTDKAHVRRMQQSDTESIEN